MKKLIFVLTVVVSLFSTSCKKVVGEGDLQTETRNVTDFSGVSASIGGKINYKIDPVYKVEITAQRNILDVIQATKQNGHLLIKVKDGVRIRSNEEITVSISAPRGDYFHLSGDGDLIVTGNINANDLDLSISGTGDLTIPTASVANNLKAAISGAGNIYVLSGSAKNEDLKISGSGQLSVEGIAAENGKTTISGSGDIKVNLSKTLDAKISGSGSVYYHGNPLISTDISGSGRVRPI